jgi:uncharacterized LabA/DUF88 family protein
MSKVMVLVDGSNVFHSLKRHGWKMNYQEFKNLLCEISEATDSDCTYVYYGSRPANTPSKQKNFLFYLQHLGFDLRISVLKERHGESKEKGVDADIVNDLNTILNEGGCQTVVLVGGDKDFQGTLEKLKSKKIKIILASFEDSTSFEMRLIAHKFVSLDKSRDRLEVKKELLEGKADSPEPKV